MVGIHFALGLGLGYASILDWPNAFLLGLVLATLATVAYVVLVAMDMVDRGLPLGCLVAIIPTVLAAILLLQILVRWILTLLGTDLPRF